MKGHWVLRLLWVFDVAYKKIILIDDWVPWSAKLNFSKNCIAALVFLLLCFDTFKKNFLRNFFEKFDKISFYKNLTDGYFREKFSKKVYILILPGFGIISHNIRQEGSKIESLETLKIIYAIASIVLLGFIVWAHWIGYTFFYSTFRNCRTPSTFLFEYKPVILINRCKDVQCWIKWCNKIFNILNDLNIIM